MEKLKALTAYLRNPAVLKRAGIQCHPENIDSWVEKGDPEFLGDDTGGGIDLFRHKYQCTITFESVAGDIRNLIALVLIWLTLNDASRKGDLDDPGLSWEGEPFDHDTSDISIELWFLETVHFEFVERSTGGAVGYKGGRHLKIGAGTEIAADGFELPATETEHG